MSIVISLPKLWKGGDSLDRGTVNISFQKWFAIGCLFLGFSVIFGAFGAHALKDTLNVHYMKIYDKSVFYQFVHGLGILCMCLGARMRLVPEAAARLSCMLFTAGIFVFSGSLYLYVLSDIKFFAYLTPLGGLSFMAGWFSVVALSFRETLHAGSRRDPRADS